MSQRAFGKMGAAPEVQDRHPCKTQKSETISRWTQELSYTAKCIQEISKIVLKQVHCVLIWSQ